MRRGVEPITNLVPLSQGHARRKSLSSIYGLGRQALHSDGAHLCRPPDTVVLFSEYANSTATLIWNELHSVSAADMDALANGSFLARGGPRTFLVHAFSDWGLHFDPGCMRPLDQRARHVVDLFSGAGSEVVKHPWVRQSQYLLLDNRRVLHARDAVCDGDDSRNLYRVAYWTD